MKYFFLLGLLVLPVVITIFDGGVTRCLASAADPVEEEDEDVDVADEETAMTDDGQEGGTGDEEDAGDSGPEGSPFASIVLLFIKPMLVPETTLELPAGKVVEFLIGFLNKGTEDLILETLDASFRYPMDFNYHIQNFSVLAFEKPVKPGHEATIAYSFLPAEAFAGRPVGLSINLKYRDLNGNPYHEGVYNETINVIEIEEGLDGETFFLYVFLGACGVLLLVIGQQFLVSVGKKRVSTTTKRPTVETGTTNHNDIDYDWLPRETLQSLNKSPRVRQTSKQYNQTIKQSPRPRKTKRAAGSDE